MASETGAGGGGLVMATLGANPPIRLDEQGRVLMVCPGCHMERHWGLKEVREIIAILKEVEKVLVQEQG